ncbi:hypothetical protein ACS0PU_000542 [Formica fusca]
MAPDNLYTGTALNNAHLNESYEVRDLWDSLLNYHHCFANRIRCNIQQRRSGMIVKKLLPGGCAPFMVKAVPRK